MTPKERAAMQQAIEFIVDCEYGKAELALREALAEQAEQEPVAWMDLHKELGKLRWMGGDEGWDNAINAVRDRLIELATPHPVRTKDLTDDEIEAIRIGIIAYEPTGYGRVFARAVIAAAIRARNSHEKTN